MRYTVDWVQFLAVIAMLVTYVMTIVFAIGAWPHAAIASAIATFVAFGVWLCRRDANGSQQ